MSRYKEWTSSLNGISNGMKNAGFVVNSNNYRVEEEIIREFCKVESIYGSFSQRVLSVSENYGKFKEFLKTKIKTKTT